jgi:hypothetical protein
MSRKACAANEDQSESHDDRDTNDGSEHLGVPREVNPFGHLPVNPHEEQTKTREKD